MKVSFAHLEMENFKSFAGRHELPLKDFAYGLHFVKGDNQFEPRLESNGAGKSTIWDALCWCLYGKTPGGLRNPDVRPWEGKKSTIVEVELYRDKKRHVVTRTISPNALRIDGKDAGPEAVEKLVGMDYELFTNAVILGQGRPLFYDLQPRDKMQLFVNALQLDRWDRRSDFAADRAKFMEGQVLETTGVIEGLETALHEIQIMHEAEDRKAQTWEDDIEALMKESRKKVKVMRREQEEFGRKKDKADLSLEGAETELRALQKQLTKDEDAVLEAEAKHTRAKVTLDTIEREVNEMVRDAKALGSGDACPTCGQSLKGTALAKHRRNLSAKIDQWTSRLNDNKTILETGNALNEAVARMEATRKHIEEFQAKANEAKDSFEFNNKQYQEVKAEADALDQLNKKRDREVNPHTSTLRTLKDRRKRVEGQVGQAKDELRVFQRKGERYKFWVKGFKDVRLYVLEEVLQELELATNAMMEEAGLIGWSVRYLIERETKSGSMSRGLSIFIKSPRSAGEVRWESWSGGEGQRLRVVGALALSEVLLQHAMVRTDLEVLDEPTQHLSTQGVTDLCEYLSDRARRLDKAIWYCDQQSVESTRFASVVTVIRDRNGSHIEE
jgi:DNA repair exonuclease SbcCD ATPase subunit